MEKIKDIANQFCNKQKENILDISTNDSGNINKTYVVTYEHNNKKEKIIIQKINTTVFKEPYKLMNNIVNVTNWISEETKKNGDACPCLKVIKTIDGNPLAVVPDENGENQYYRAYNFIENSITYDVSTDTKIVYISYILSIAYFWPVFPRISCMGCITGKTSFPFSIVIFDDNCMSHCLGLSLLFVFYEFTTFLSVFLLDIRV